MPSSYQPITITAAHHNTRLDIALVETLTISRSLAQTMIEEGRVLVNGKQPKKAGDRVKTNDTVTFIEPAVVAEVKAPFGIKKNTPTRTTPIAEVKIMAATPHFIVVEKPSGMLTHPTEAGETNTLANFLTTQFPELSTVGDSPERPGIVHRLDKEASGLLVVARTQTMFDYLKDQFKNRTIGKHYTVLVHDPMPRVEGTIDFPIERSENAERMAAVPKTEKGLTTDKGKEALTDFLVIKNYVNFSLLDVTIHTGRMHQIRAHMFAYNHPVVGDPLYIQKKRARTWDERCGRLFLHCSQLSFKDLDGLPQEFESDLPGELVQFLGTLV